MATQSLMNDQAQVDKGSSRLVWVLNSDKKPYKGTFRTRMLVIPPNNEKIAKRAEDGGNLMPYLEARRFISDLKEAQDYVMDSMGKPQPTYGPKALIDEELTREEYEKFVGKTADQIQKESEKEEKKAKRDFSKALKQPRMNKVSLEDQVEP